MDVATPEAVLEFWFADALDDPARHAARSQTWFSADPAFDERVRTRFGPTFERAERGELKRWRLSAHGTLALVLLFDQFPRNMFRATARAFACDQRAQALARDGVAGGIDRELRIGERTFFYLPFEHAEDAQAQAKSLECHGRLHDEAPAAWRAVTADALHWARIHHDIIARFGRFPHRNLILDRPSRADEIAWLGEHGNTFGQG